MVQPSVLKNHKRLKMIETKFYRLYSIKTGSKIIAGSRSENWHLILKLLLVFYCQFVAKFADVCNIRVFLLKKLSHFLRTLTDKLVLTYVCGRN